MQQSEPTSVAILFDLDGTLIDSEPVWDRATRELASTRGTDIAHELLLSISGLDASLAMKFLHRELAWEGYDVAADVGFVQDRVRSSYKNRVNWLPGARELLAATRDSGLRSGLVTSTYRPLVDIVLDSMGKDVFDVVVCGDDGYEPKPHPEPYLKAISSLGLRPTDCVVVEDSARGVASARAAECAVLHVSPLLVVDDADAHVTDLKEVSVPLLLDLLTARRCPERPKVHSLQ